MDNYLQKHIENVIQLYWIKGKKNLLFSNDSVEIYRGVSPVIFYRGIAAYTPNYPSNFTYNIKEQIKLTEDRTFADLWHVNFKIAQSIIDSDNEEIILPSIISGKHYENSLDFRFLYGKPSFSFKKCVREIRATATAQITDSALTFFYKNADEISDIFKIINPTEEQMGYFNKAKYTLLKAGLIPNIDKYEVIFVEKLANQCGEAISGKIIINTEICSANMNELITTILEEYLHLEENMQNCSRTFQNRLFELISQLIMRDM